jgi:superfamily II DNA or RNA helicase
MITIHITNNVCSIKGYLPSLNKLYKAFEVRNPNAFHLRKYMPAGWNGKKPFISPTGKFDTGLLFRVVTECDELDIEYELVDQRANMFNTKKNKERLEDMGLRDYQLDAVLAVIRNKIKGIRIPRGTIKVATNGGKTYISGGIYLAYRQPTIFLMNSAELFNDALVDLPKLLGEPVGQVSSKKIEWAPFMVCMVATTKNRLKDPAFRKKIAEYRVLIVDECDMAANKTNKTVMQNLFNTVVRIGLSGTVNVTDLKKDLIKNMTVEGYFGPQLYDISNRALIDKGVSSEVAVEFVLGNEKDEETGKGWMEDYTKYVVKNGRRNKRILARSQFHWEQGRRRQLIIAQRKDHILRLYKRFRKHYPDTVTIDWVHSERKERKQITRDFQDGKLDILIGSMILKRGKNFKLMNYMLNAGAGRSPENVLQLLGRAFRGCKHYEDMHDAGRYLRKHTRARQTMYKREKIKVTNKYS